MLHEMIRNNGTQRCNIVSSGYNIVSTLQRCVGLKIVVANHLLNRGLKIGVFGHFWRTVNVKKSPD